MRAIYFLFIFLLILGACNIGTRELNIPDTVAVTKTSQHVQVPGSRLFIVPPPGFKFTKSNTLKKDDGSEIMIADFPESKFNRDNRIPDSPGETTFYEKLFVIGGYKARLSYGKALKENKEKIVFVFGDDQNSILADCTFPVNNKKSRDEAIGAVLSIFLDKSMELDYAALNNYTINTDNSAFKLYGNNKLLFYYSINGEEIKDNNNYITIARLPAFPRMEEMKAVTKGFISKIEKGMRIEKIDDKPVKIHGQPAYEAIISAVANNVLSERLYLLVMGNTKSSIYYLGVFEASDSTVFEECKALAQTLRLK
ncbi:hypothetical protein DVR12_03785 [Chitinophaga silvatica]|uniref:Uncharacterized protein n=1 Tax=Chitinophaga silvatica TaxID=2282649 RepID=A0A3E1YHT1_9BACT|nr:hypothetical protein [Chitinophaga silvatica]RFS26917.1 hypothetical protein DVR12_03785 [Chitinophaga silvatica]